MHHRSSPNNNHTMTTTISNEKEPLVTNNNDDGTANNNIRETTINVNVNAVKETQSSSPLSSSSNNINTFYPNSPITSWYEFFTMKPIIPNPPKGSYVGTKERLEVLFAIAFLFIAVVMFWGKQLHYISYHFGKYVGDLEMSVSDEQSERTGLNGLRLSSSLEQQAAENNNNSSWFSFVWSSILFPRWLFPLGYDIADEQWRSFDANMGSLLLGMFSYVGLSRAARYVSESSPEITYFFELVNNNNPNLLHHKTSSSSSSSSSNLFVTIATNPIVTFFLRGSSLHLVFLAILNTVIIYVLHSWGFALLIPILFIHYFFTVYIGPRIPRWIFLTVMWVTLTTLLLTVEWYSGFESWLKNHFPDAVETLFGKRTPLILWNAVFNMQMLRMVAFSVDYLEAKDKGEARRKEVEIRHTTTCHICGELAKRSSSNEYSSSSNSAAVLSLANTEIKPLCYKARTDTPRSIDEYASFINFLAYILYLPLYIGGPISSFNAFISHIKTSPQKSMDRPKELLRYAFRVCCLYYCLQLLLHFIFINSIRTQQSAVRNTIPPFYQNGLMYYMLAFLWLKFSVIWKGFRFFGLLDGVEAPEDMQRCFSNTVRVSEFWRDWHSSFNLWIVRYMYIPLGGNKYKAFVVFPIFFFIAIWHDSKLELLSWALVMCVNFALELTLTMYCSKLPYWKKDGPGPYRYWVTLGGVYTILALIISNSIGFGVGNLSAEYFAKTLTKENFFIFILWFIGCFSSCTIALLDREMAANRERKAKDELREALALVGK